MEDILLSNIQIKSKIQDYKVEFISDLTEALQSKLKAHDFLIIDNKVKTLYGKYLNTISDNYKFITIDATETQKSYEGVISIIQTLIENGFKKNHRLVAIGGGITQDVTAFIASIFFRGVKWAFFPSTLLAQGDSCIGSKTSINFKNYKNQLGGFYPPEIIYIYPRFTKTLPETDMKSGMGEMLHYFIISGKDDFDLFKESYITAYNNLEVLAKLIERSLKIKQSVIEKDEFDQNIRQVFNYGHSFGHAIESITNYQIPHGIAVSFGMDIANFISVKLGFTSENTRIEIRNVLENIWFGYSINKTNIDELIHFLGKDKKNVGSKLSLILNGGIGNVFKSSIEPNDVLKEWLKEYFLNQA